MQISDLIEADSVFCNLQASSKKHLLQTLAGEASRMTGLSERDILERILERERLGTTGVGNGVAIPHGKFSELECVHSLFATLKNPVEYESVDDEPVDLVCLLLAPEESGTDHLRALAKMSQLLRNADYCERLRSTNSNASLFECLINDSP